MTQDHLVFACEQDGLPSVLERGLLGAYDGVGGWRTELSPLKDGDEQLMVEIHEGLHHNLQASTGWGRLSAHALMLSRSGYRQNVLGEVFDLMTEGCRQTHETYATTLSAGVHGLSHGRALLTGNPRYEAYLARGHALAGADETPWQFRESAASAVLHCCMAPRSVLELTRSGYENLRVRHVRAPDRPDDRLALFESSGGPASWAPMFERLLAEHPSRGGDFGGPEGRSLPHGREQLHRLRAFEEDILIRRCYEHCVRILEAAGSPSVAWEELASLPGMHIAAVQRVDANLAAVMKAVTVRSPVVQDTLEYDRQALGLRERLPVELVPAEETMALSKAFEVADGDGDPSAVAVWLDRNEALRQFAFPAGTELPDPVAGLLAAGWAADGTRTVRLGLLPPSMTPLRCQEALGDVALVVLASHSVLVEPPPVVREALLSVEPVHVVMDLLVLPHLRYWVRDGATVSWALAPLRGTAVDLSLLVFAVDRAPGLLFLHLGSRLSVGWTAQNVLSDRSDRFVRDGSLLAGGSAALGLAVSTVLSTWSTLAQRELL